MCELTKKDAINFVLSCYFGNMEDPVLAAIDRAYRDMAAHTMTKDKVTGKNEGTDDYRLRGRKEATESIYKAIQSLTKETDYEKWFNEEMGSIKEIYEKYNYCITEGQVQKWINMTVKYLVTFVLIGVEGINAEAFESYDKFYAPIDSYVIRAKGIDENAWSKITNYSCCRDEANFVEEYLNWASWSKQYRSKAVKESYEAYINENKYNFSEG